MAESNIIQRELVDILAARILYADQAPLISLGKLPPYNDLTDSEGNSLGAAGVYLGDFHTILGEYLDALDPACVLKRAIFDPDAIARVDPIMAQKVESLNEARQKSGAGVDFAANFKEVVDAAIEAGKDAAVVAKDVDEGDITDIISSNPEAWQLSENFDELNMLEATKVLKVIDQLPVLKLSASFPDNRAIPDSLLIPADCDESDIQKVVSDLRLINKCYYETYAESNAEDEEDEPGYIAGFNAAYIWVEQALSELETAKPNTMFSVKPKPPVTLSGSPSPSPSCRLN